jgi:hypothetical protein
VAQPNRDPECRLMSQRTQRNHFVPQGYLKRWAGDDRRLWVYRLIVPHEGVQSWKRRSIRGVAWHQHLYTQLAAGDESDEIERWLDQEFEAPAQEALDRVLEDKRLTGRHWRALTRFVAAQHVRTPARFLEMMSRWSAELQPLVDQTLRSSVARLEELHQAGKQLPLPSRRDHDNFPSRVSIRRLPSGGGELGLEVVAGRAMWMFALRHLLTQTARALEGHKWTILMAPEEMHWATSDDPVIPLNYYEKDRYDFRGGWDSKGTEILLPLSPRHLLYTCIGNRQRPKRQVDPGLAAQFQHIILEHAHRVVFAATPVPRVEEIRPRVVDRQQYYNEAEAWQQWHREQSHAEMEIRQ